MYGWGPWGKPHGNEGLIALLIIAAVYLLAMPIVGLVYVAGNDENKKTKGAIMLVVGIIIWIVVLCK